MAAADEIGLGERKIVDVAGRSIGVFNIGGEFFALRNRCPHQAGALCEGALTFLENWCERLDKLGDILLPDDQQVETDTVFGSEFIDNFGFIISRAEE